MRQTITLVAFCLGLILFNSCGAPKDIAYFQNEGQLTPEAMEKMKNYLDPTIKEGDELTIVVASNDPNSVTPFNLPLVSFVRSTAASSSSNASTQATNVAATQSMQTYLVDVAGEINFPVIGHIKIAGLKKREATQFLENKISSYVKDPIVNINIINYKITILGEVNRPGSYTITTDRVSLLDALGYAGDLTIYGNRTNIKMIRDVNGTKQIHLFDISKSDFLADPSFYLQQNDVIYVEPNPRRKKVSQYSQTDQFRLQIVTAAATVCSVITSLVVALTRK